MIVEHNSLRSNCRPTHHTGREPHHEIQETAPTSISGHRIQQEDGKRCSKVNHAGKTDTSRDNHEFDGRDVQDDSEQDGSTENGDYVMVESRGGLGRDLGLEGS